MAATYVCVCVRSLYISSESYTFLLHCSEVLKECLFAEFLGMLRAIKLYETHRKISDITQYRYN
jgi:hypothetical protein